MVTTERVPASRFQLACEKLLFLYALALAEAHLLWSVLMAVIPKKPFHPIEKRFALVLLIALAVYLVIYVVVYPRTLYRIRELAGRLRSFEQVFLLVMLGWYIFTCLLRQLSSTQNYFKQNDYRLFYCVLITLFLFPVSSMVQTGQARRIIDAMLHPLAAAYTVFSVWALRQVLVLQAYTLPLTGRVLEFRSGNSLGFGFNRNATGVYACAIAGICIYMLLSHRSAWRFIYLPVLAVHITVILLTNSRTSFLGSCAMFMAVLFMLAWERLEDKSLWLRIGAGLLAALVFAAIYFWLRKEAFHLLNHFTDLSGQAAAQSQTAVTARELDDLHGRDKVWRAAFMLMTSSVPRFLFGVTPYHVEDLLHAMGQYQRKLPHAHNVVLQAGCAFGVPMMLGYAAFLVSLCRKSLRILFSRRKNVIPRAWSVPMIILCLTLIDMAECFTFLRDYFTTPFYFLICGYLVMLDRRAE